MSYSGFVRYWELIKLRSICVSHKRYYAKKKITHWHKLETKKWPKDFALQHFDNFYGSVFKDWPSIRLALLCPHSYCAVVNTFSSDEELPQMFQELGTFDLEEAYNIKLSENLSQTVNNNTVNYNDEEIKIASSNTGEHFAAATSNLMTNAQNSLSNNDNLSHQVFPDEDEYIFAPVTKLKYQEEVINEEEYFEFYDRSGSFPLNIVKETVIQYPQFWKVFFYPRGKFREFPPPKQDATGLLNYYLMDGASILPVLALDVQPGEEVGDLCASPGGKSLAILLGGFAGKLLCNDVTISRVNKLKTVLKTYLPNLESLKRRILVSQIDVCKWDHYDAFDKVLLDVPCTNDRMSVKKNENSIFSQVRFQERMKIPQLQTDMLCTSLKTLKPGGSLVYSTCSLSPIQNDGVVYMALKKLWEETSGEFIVKDLTDAFYPLREIFKFSDTCKYGQLVVPFLPLNYGPMYISKITRNK